MSRRTVSVELSLEVAAYLANARRVEAASKDMREEIDRLAKAGSNLGKSGLIAMLAGLPGVASAGAAGVGMLSAAMFTGAAAAGTMALATHGVGDALSAVADGDAAKLDKAMSELTDDAQAFVREYTRVRATMDQVGDATQTALFHQLSGDLEQLTGTYIPVLLRQAPLLAREVGGIGSEFVDWATAPGTVDKVNRQFDLAIALAGHLSRMLRAGTSILLDMADAGAEFTDKTVGGLADGTEALARWVSTAKQVGQLNQIFANGGEIVEEFGDVLVEVGELLADVVDNPALVDGASALFDVLHIGLDVVHGLLSAFEALPGGMQSGIVTLAVYGGAILMVTSRVIAMKAALDQAKVSAQQNATALKGVGGMLGGPWGVALTVATIAVGAFATSQANAKAKVKELAGTLDEQTGAITDSTRAMVAQELAADKVLGTFEQLGVGSERVVDAALGDAAAMDELTEAIKRMKAEGTDRQQAAAWWAEKQFIDDIQGYSGALSESQKQQLLVSKAIDGTTAAVKAETSAMNELSSALKRQADPLFALIEAQREVTDAQVAYNEAVKEHGKGSQEAKDASLALAKAAVELTGATGEAAKSFAGGLTPELRATLEAADLTEQQIADVEAAIRAATKSAGEFEGDYEARLTAQAAQAKAEIDAMIAKVLQLKDKSIRIHAEVFWKNGGLHVPGGTILERRWGGITEHARNGLLRDAAVYSPVAAGARYAFAEPATGGEAFVPRHGDYGRSMSILSEAARWYGASVVPQGRGTAGGDGMRGGLHVENLHVSAYDSQFSLRQISDELAMQGAH